MRFIPFVMSLIILTALPLMAHRTYTRDGRWIILEGPLPHGAVDMDILPKDAEVWVEGKHLGAVDDFDGWPSFLYLEAGRYAVEIRRTGFETLHYLLDIPDRSKFRIRAEMVRSRPGEVKTPPKKRETGKLHLTVRPPDATVRINGSLWGRGEELNRLHGPLQLPAGEVIIEVVAPGHESERKVVTLTSGEYLKLEIVLQRKQP